MKKNRKGFTLVELIAVVVVIGILALIAVPMITRYLGLGKDKYYGALESEVSIMAQDYFTEHKVELPRGQKDNNGNPIYQTKITTNYLKENNFVTNDVVDSEGGNCDDSYVLVRNVGGKITYHTCLVCENYQTINEFCDGTVDGNLPSCTVSLTLGGIKYNGEWTKNDVVASLIGTDDGGISIFKTGDAKITATKSGSNYTGEYKISENGEKTYKFQAVDMSGNPGTCVGDNEQVVRIDKKGPSCKNIKITASGWQGKKTVSFDVIDKESGVSSVKIDGKALTISDGKVSYEVKENGNYSFVLTDNLGNTGTCNAKVLEIDNTGPVVTLPDDEEIIRVNQDSSVTIPIIVVEKESGLDISTFTKDDIILKVDGNVITPTKTLKYISESNGEYRYELTISTALNDGNLSLVIDDNKLYDKAENPNVKVTLDSSYKLDNTKPSNLGNISYYVEDGTRYNGEWTNKQVYTKFSAYDVGQVVEFRYSKAATADISTWSKFDFERSNGLVKNGHTYSGEEVWTLYNRNDEYYYVAKDKVGNFSAIAGKVVVKYDVSKPTCSVTSAPSSLGVGKTGSVVVTCTDSHSGLTGETLDANDFTINNASITKVEKTKVSDNSYKYILTISGTTTGTAKVGVKAGVITDLANNTNNSVTQSGSITITSISATPAEVTLDLSGTKTQQITVSGYNYGTASYKSANSSVASVSSSGLITGLKVGSTTITVTGSNGGPTATVKVTVVKTHNVKFMCSTNGGTKDETKKVNSGSSFPANPTCTKSGYTFLGFSTDSGATSGNKNYGSGTTVTSDVTLYGIYRKTVTVRFNRNNAASITPSGGSASTGSYVDVSCYAYNTATSCSITSPAISAPTNTPSVVGWNTSSDSTSSAWDASTAKTFSGAATYYAITRKAAVTRTATFTVQDTSAATSSSTSAKCTIAATYNGKPQSGSCTTTAPTLTAKSGYKVAGWNTNESATTSSVGSGANVTLSSNPTYYSITYKPSITRTISYSKGTGVSSIGKTSDSCTIAAAYNGASQSGSCSVTLPSITASSGYKVLGWYQGSTKKGNAGVSLALKEDISLLAKAEASFTLTCPSTGYINEEVTCNTNKAGVTITCSGVSLSSAYDKSFTTTSSDMTKTCIPTSSGTLKFTATMNGTTIAKEVTIRPFKLSCPSSGYTWEVVTCNVTASGVLMTCGGNVTLSSSYPTSFTTTSSDMSKSCLPTSTGTLTVTASKSGYSTSKNISISSGGGGGGGSSYTLKSCQLSYAFGDKTTAHYIDSICTTKTVYSCPTVYPNAVSCANAGYASGDYCPVSCD